MREEHPMKLTARRLAGFGALWALMTVTRSGHLGTAWQPPDASWAVLYIAGFYFWREWRWALPTLLCSAIAVDFIVIRDFGVSAYCVTVAYIFMLPAYSLLWLGGAWMRRAHRHDLADPVRCVTSLAIAASLCFFLTDATFYWLGGRVPDPSLGGWWQNLTQWYPGFIGVPFGYVGIAALLHTVWARSGRARVAADVH
jgi:hypothetical protein